MPLKGTPIDLTHLAVEVEVGSVGVFEDVSLYDGHQISRVLEIAEQVPAVDCCEGRDTGIS